MVDGKLLRVDVGYGVVVDNTVLRLHVNIPWRR